MLFAKTLKRVLRSCVLGVAVIVTVPASAVLVSVVDGSEFVLNYSFLPGDTANQLTNTVNFPGVAVTSTLYEDLDATGSVLQTATNSSLNLLSIFPEILDGAFSVLVTGSGAGAPGSFELIVRVNRGGAQVFVEPEVIDRNAVPEPATLALLGLGLAGIGLTRRKR